jgi:hypothetical protein
MIALTSYRASGAEKVAQVLLTVDGLAFIPVITASADRLVKLATRKGLEPFLVPP